jgi:hypothetical protein
MHDDCIRQMEVHIFHANPHRSVRRGGVGSLAGACALKRIKSNEGRHAQKAQHTKKRDSSHWIHLSNIVIGI